MAHESVEEPSDSVAVSYIGLLPKSAALIDAFRRGGHGSCPVVGSAAAMASHHLRQWKAEDVSRSAATPYMQATAKQAIDELNIIRVGLVEQVDRWAATTLPEAPNATLHTETLGSVIDRFAIAWVRYQQLLEQSRTQEMARVALRQMSELAVAYDDLARDVTYGIRRLPDWRSLKRYGTQE